MKERTPIRLIFSFLWLVSTLSFGIWWWILGVRQAETIARLSPSLGASEELFRVHRMLQMEGVVFFLLLILGGGTLAFFSLRDRKRTYMLSDFFGALTHEMKTPMASLQLQVESLIEETKDKKLKKSLENLMKENLRIQSRMEKAFHLASILRGESIFLTKFEWKSIEENLKYEFPGVDWRLPNHILHADERALELVLRNLIENALLHGRASKVSVSGKMTDNEIQIAVEDNGLGFQGNWQDLSKPFQRPTPRSGSGIGLYISKELLKKMSGHLNFSPNQEGSGFCATILLPLAR